MRLALNFQRIDPTRGGAETYVVDLCQRLVRAGHQLDVFANSWKAGALPEAVGMIRVEAQGWSRSGRIWNFARNSARALAAASDRYDCSIGLINTWHHDVIIPQGGVHQASLAANAMRFPSGWRRSAYILGKRANPKARLYRAIERRQYDPARSARVVAVSEMVRGHLEKFHEVPRDRIRVIPNAINTDRLAVEDPARARRDFRRDLGLGPDDLIALFVGHNYSLKGLKPLLMALEERRRLDPSARPIHLLACGGGRPAPFRELVRELGLDDVVHLQGFVPEIRSAFHASDFFVLPTYYDPCSLVVFEALACGLPVITTACNGAGEIMTEGREGFVIPAPDDRGSLIQAMGRMVDDEARREMSAHARRLGREQSFDQHVARLIDLFEDVAGSRGSFARSAA
ncbi:glycosyltransferase family 4 protein [Tundrisphaera lichenicola]|uniref:glycosyltransferase family 4 protein n=1 Tax=Tundrisphaera lichenicola TaxID=2029860 RepID=UPI003EBD1F5E